jgi:hypothetical protein
MIFLTWRIYSDYFQILLWDKGAQTRFYISVVRCILALVGSCRGFCSVGSKKSYVRAQRSEAYCGVSVRDFSVGLDLGALQRVPAGGRKDLVDSKAIVQKFGGEFQI